MKVQDFLTAKHVSFEVHAHPEAYDAQHLAQSLHVAGRNVAKTVLVRANHGYKYVVAVLPAHRHIDLARLSAALGGAAVSLATEAEIGERCPDCEFGVLPPFGSQYNLTTVADCELAKDDEIYFAGDTHREAIGMAYKDFDQVEHPLVAPFAAA
jgi:Ala-tRNA(Pro) deacylase